MSTTYYLFFQYGDFEPEFFDVVEDPNSEKIRVHVKALNREFDAVGADFNITAVRENELDPVDKAQCQFRRAHLMDTEAWLVGDAQWPQSQRRAAAYGLSRKYREAMSEPADASAKADAPSPAVAESTPGQADLGKPREDLAGGDDSVADLQDDASTENDRQLKVTEVARITGLNTGVISRAVDHGEIASNGEKGRARRISLASAEEFADAYRKKQQIRDGAKSEFIRESTADVEAAFRRTSSNK